MKVNKNLSIENEANVTNLSTEEAVSTTQKGLAAAEQSEDTLTDEQRAQLDTDLKARQVLTVTLPKLKHYKWNFEKRSGNFFKSVMVDNVDKNGVPLAFEADGVTVAKRPARLVQSEFEIDHVTEDGKTVLKKDENGEYIPTTIAIECKDEIALRRAAKFVTEYDKMAKKSEEDVDKAYNIYKEALSIRENLEGDYKAASELVNAFVIPEAEKTTRSTKVAELESKVNEANEKLQQARIRMAAAGMSDEEIDAILG